MNQIEQSHSIPGGIDIESKMQEFANLEPEKQQAISTKIIENLAAKGNEDAIAALPEFQAPNTPSQERVFAVYKSFLEASNKTKEKQHEADVNNFEKGQEVIASIHAEESTSREEEKMELAQMEAMFDEMPDTLA